MKRSVLRNMVTAPTNSAPMPTIIRTLAMGDRLYEGYATSVIITPMTSRTAPVRRKTGEGHDDGSEEKRAHHLVRNGRHEICLQAYRTQLRDNKAVYSKRRLV